MPPLLPLVWIHLALHGRHNTTFLIIHCTFHPLSHFTARSVLFFLRWRFTKKDESLMFLIFLACLTYFWLWLETARPPVCEMQSYYTSVIWIIELGLVSNGGKKCMCVDRFVFNRECHCFWNRLARAGVVHFHAMRLRWSNVISTLWCVTYISGVKSDECFYSRLANMAI